MARRVNGCDGEVANAHGVPVVKRVRACWDTVRPPSVHAAAMRRLLKHLRVAKSVVPVLVRGEHALEAKDVAETVATLWLSRWPLVEARFHGRHEKLLGLHGTGGELALVLAHFEAGARDEVHETSH